VAELERVIAAVSVFLAKDPIPTGVVEAPPALPAFAILAASTRGPFIVGLDWSYWLPCLHGRIYVQVSFPQCDPMSRDNGGVLAAEACLKRDS